MLTEIKFSELGLYSNLVLGTVSNLSIMFSDCTYHGERKEIERKPKNLLPFHLK